MSLVRKAIVEIKELKNYIEENGMCRNKYNRYRMLQEIICMYKKGLDYDDFRDAYMDNSDIPYIENETKKRTMRPKSSIKKDYYKKEIMK